MLAPPGKSILHIEVTELAGGGLDLLAHLGYLGRRACLTVRLAQGETDKRAVKRQS